MEKAIVAISTAMGNSGIGIVRISGKETFIKNDYVLNVRIKRNDQASRRLSESA